MKALSIQQPWASLIAQGLKTIEVRSWQTPFRGRFVICASARPDEILKAVPKLTDSQLATFCRARNPYNNQFEGYYMLGHAICIAELYDIEPMNHTHEAGALVNAWPGAYAWKLRNIEFITPFPVKGQLGFYNVNIK